MQSKAKTVEAYLKELPPDRRAAIQAVRAVILKNLDKGYREGMSYGMIGYYVPHELYPAGYHCDPKLPLPYAGLASQKQHMSVYLFGLYGMTGEERAFRTAWEKTGRTLDMGKCCVRFKKLEDVALDVLGEAIKNTPVKWHIAHYEAAILTMNTAKAARKEAARGGGSPKKGAAKNPAAKAPAKTAAGKKKVVGKKKTARR